MRTAFVIGLGGTGDWVLTFLKAKIEATHGKVPENVRLRLLDTIARDLREGAFRTEDRSYRVKGVLGDRKEKVAQVSKSRIEGSEYFALVPSSTEDLFRRAEEIKNGGRPHMNWFRADYYLQVVPRANFSLSDGAGQWRQFGRMGIFYFSSALTSDLPSMLANGLSGLKEQRGQASDSKIDVFLVGSLAGGTGAGIFLDVGNLVREISNLWKIPINLVAMLVLPGAFSQIPTADVDPARAYAAFLELHRFQSHFGSDNPFSVTYTPSFQTTRGEKLFDGVYLLDAERSVNSLGGARPEAGLFPSIADGLELFLDENSGSQLVQNSCNVTATHVRNVNEAVAPAIYSSFGTWKILLPARLYCKRFAHQQVQEYLNALAPRDQDEAGAWRLKSNFIGGQAVPVDHHRLAIRLLSKSHAFFQDFLERLPDQEEHYTLEGFAEGLSSARILNKYLTVQDQAANQQLEIHAPNLVREVVETVQDGSVTGHDSDKAIKYLRDQSRGRREEYFIPGGEFDNSLSEVMRLVEQEINRAINNELNNLLKGDSPKEKIGQLGYLHRLLVHLDEVLNSLNTHVMAIILDNVDEQRGSLQKVENRMRDAEANLDQTRGMDGGFLKSKSKKSWAAQKAYLQAVKAWIQREQHDRLLKALGELNSRVAANISKWIKVVWNWADALALGTGSTLSALQACGNRINMVDDDLRRIGQSYTSSLGLTVWKPGSEEPLDTSMGGYRDKLYSRLQAGRDLLPLWEEWLADTQWEVQLPGERDGDLHLNLTVNNGQKALKQMDLGEVHDALAEEAFKHFQSGMAKESILDYLALQSTAEQVAEALSDKTAPMLATGDHQGGHQPASSLIFQAQPQHAEFMEKLKKLLAERGRFGAEVSLQEAYNDPFTVIFAVMADKVVEGEIKTMNDCADSYWREMENKKAEAMQQLQYHIFNCEQQAAMVLKDYYAERKGNFSGAQALSPVVVQVLERPDYVRSFLHAWSHGLIFSGYCNEFDGNLWCLVYQNPAEGPVAVDRVYSGEVPGIVLAMESSENNQTRQATLLDALCNFCLRQKCLKRNVNRVDLGRLNKIMAEMREQQRLIEGSHDGLFEAMAGHYHKWFQKCDPLADSDPELTEFWNKMQPVGSDWDRTSLRIVLSYYFAREANNWRKRL